MSKLFLYAALGLLFGLKAVPSCSVGNAAEIDFIIEGADFGDKLISSGQGKLIYEYVRVDSLSQEAQNIDKLRAASLTEGMESVANNSEKIILNVAFKGDQIKCDELSWKKLPDGRKYSQVWQWAYNGEKLDLLRLDGLGDNDMIIPFGSVRTNNDIPLERFDPRYLGMNIFGTPVASFLKGSLDGQKVEDVEVIGEEYLENKKCKIIKGRLPDSNETITVWLAQDTFFRPIRVVRTSVTNIVEINNTLVENEDGSWFPRQIEKNVFYIPSTSKKVLYSREILRCSSNFKLNIDIDSSDFEIEFPKGMSVYDYRLGKRISVE